MLIPRLRSSTKCLQRVFTKPENALHWATQACNEAPYKKTEKKKERKKERKKEKKPLMLCILVNTYE